MNLAKVLLLLVVGTYHLHAIDASTPKELARSDGAFSPAEVRSVGVLGLATRTLPQRLRLQLKADLGIKYRAIDPSAARRLAAAVWLVGGHGVVCLVADSNGAAACSRDRRFVRHGIFLGTFHAAAHEKMPRDFMVIGVVPDWVSSLEIEIDRGRSVLPVNGNVVRVQASSPILVRRLIA
jgi:hypothetical protein